MIRGKTLLRWKRQSNIRHANADAVLKPGGRPGGRHPVSLLACVSTRLFCRSGGIGSNPRFGGLENERFRACKSGERCVKMTFQLGFGASPRLKIKGNPTFLPYGQRNRTQRRKLSGVTWAVPQSQSYHVEIEQITHISEQCLTEKIGFALDSKRFFLCDERLSQSNKHLSQRKRRLLQRK